MRKQAVFLSFFLIVIYSEGAAFLSKWLLSPDGHRQNPGSLWQCPALPPDMTYCSHSSSSPESIQEANVWIALLGSHCHPQAMKFVCTVYNPVCLHSHQIMPILPCREFCTEVHNACVSRMYLFGFKWPQQVDCDRFPSEHTSMCISSKRGSVTCAPCSQEVKRGNIVEKYCKADVVVKSQISGVTAFGNTSSLLVNLDRISEHLFPQPPVPSPSNLKPNGMFVPSTGFVDTNDERFLMISQARRLNHEFNLDKQTNDIVVHEQADQPVNFPFSTPTTNLLMLPSNDPNEYLKSERRRRREERLRGKLDGRRSRDKRSPITQLTPETDGSLSQGMLLECAGCSLQLPTSPMAPNSATRWLVMAKKLDKPYFNHTSASPMMQIISLMQWQKDNAEFRDALRDIRTIPRNILCNPNTKVELNLDGFHRSEAQMSPTSLASPRASWSRHGWITQRKQPSPQWNLPTPFEGLFQNDAAIGNRKTRKQRQQMNRRRNQSNELANDKPMSKEEKERRRRRRKKRLARMTPQQREAWKAQRRIRRAQKQMMKTKQITKLEERNHTTGTHARLL